MTNVCHVAVILPARAFAISIADVPEGRIFGSGTHANAVY
jgi:hypothetical protein